MSDKPISITEKLQEATGLCYESASAIVSRSNLLNLENEDLWVNEVAMIVGECIADIKRSYEEMRMGV